MGKRKQFHCVNTPLKMLQYGQRNAIGPLYRWSPKRKKLINTAAPEGTATAYPNSSDELTENG